MQDQYVSLNPSNTLREEKAIRNNLYQQRLLESQGGSAAVTVGTQWGLTAAVLTYSACRESGFRMFPLAASKSPSYAKISMAFLFFYSFGHSYVSSKFGDRRSFNHLFSNKGAIMAGSKSYDREE